MAQVSSPATRDEARLSPARRAGSGNEREIEPRKGRRYSSLTSRAPGALKALFVVVLILAGLLCLSYFALLGFHAWNT